MSLKPKKQDAISGDRNFVLIVTGEASGDLHGANLVKAMSRFHSELTFWGLGGSKMEEAGVRILNPSADLAPVGLTEVISRLHLISKAYFRLKNILKYKPPALLILIDFPTFNLKMARLGKKYGVPVLYYITPQIWAWRSGRSLKLKQRVDRMAVILPFEEAFFQKRGMKVDYVGHPILDTNRRRVSKAEAVRNLGLDGGNPVIGLIPGSRDEEVRNLLPKMIEAVKIIASQYPNIKCALPVAPSISNDLIQSFVKKSPVEIRMVNGQIDQILNACDLALVTSGTATLETALMEVPMVIVYKISPVSFRAAKLLVKVPYIGLVNLVAGEEVAKELIQDDLTPQRLADEALSLLQADQKREDMIKKLKMINKRLGSGGASERTAKIALEMIERHDYGSNHFNR